MFQIIGAMAEFERSLILSHQQFRADLKSPRFLLCPILCPPGFFLVPTFLPLEPWGVPPSSSVGRPAQSRLLGGERNAG
jgi:hypothetical protein